MEDDDLLDDFLAVAESLTEPTPKPEETKTEIKKNQITNQNEDELFLESIDEFCRSLDPSILKNKKLKEVPKVGSDPKKKSSTIHNGDTDSSDDESNRDYQNSKYNEYGKEIKHLLTSQATTSSFTGDRSTWKPKRPVACSQPSLPFQKKEEVNVMTDPFFGIRIVNPIISSVVLKERMTDRQAISMAQLKQFTKSENNKQDWVIAGVIVSKSPVKTSQKGNKYLIWTLSDLKGDLKTCAVFLFASAYKQLWKTAAGTVLGILNPSIMETREGSKDEASLSVDNAQKVMIFGHSKDLGTCRSKKKDGQPCTAFVNKNSTEYCLYHIKSEYQKLSKRSELQANFVGGGLTALRNKVLGKNEVFYAGKSYMAIPAKKSSKLAQKDNERLRSLSSLQKNGILTQIREGAAPKIKTAATLDVSKAQRIKDLELLRKLKGEKTAIEKNSKGLEIDFKKVETETEKVLNSIEKLEKKLEIRGTSKEPNLTEFDFLSETPSNNTPKIQNSKLTDEILGVLDNIDPNVTPRKNKNLIGLPRTPNSTKKRFERVEIELQDMFNSPKSLKKGPRANNTPSETGETKNGDTGILKTPTSKKALGESATIKNEPETLKSKNQGPIIDKTPNKTKNGNCQILKTPSSKITLGESLTSQNKPSTSNLQKTPTLSKMDTQSDQGASSKGLVPKNHLKTPTLKNGTQDICFEDKLSSQTPSNSKISSNNLGYRTPQSQNSQRAQSSSEKKLKDSTNFLQNSQGSFLKNSNLDTEELNELAGKSKFFSKPCTPKLKNFENFGDSKIDLSAPLERNGSLLMNKAKLNALRYVQKKGPIKKDDNEAPKKQGVKRFLAETADDFREKKPKLADNSFTSERFKKIMSLQSKHTDLLNAEDLEKEEKYFRKLEVKEKMEEKMATVFKVECKAVRCLTCKYEAFSASDKCKEERHVLKVFDAVKRFFKCAKCGNRTVSLKIIPLISCTNCGGSKWDRTTMMKEKVVQMGEKLSIRGLEEKYVGSINTGGNINLLVPDE